MKAILTLVSVLILGLSSYANTGEQVKNINLKLKNHVEVTPIQMDIILDRGIIVASNSIEVQIVNEKNVARLYKFKNSRIKKALAFRTKRSRPIIA